MVTAILTTYNRPEQSVRALKSILSQTYHPSEIIVVEDASNSGIDDWINDAQENIKYIRHEKNKGLAAARNTGIENASYEYVAFLDDDDVWKPTRLERQANYINNLGQKEVERLGILYCGNEPMYNQDDSRINMPRQSGLMKDEFLKKGPHTLSSAFLFNRKALKAVGGFDEALPSSIDHDIWMALAYQGYYIHSIDQSLVYTNTSVEVGERMIHNVRKRMKGVGMYVEKWMPVFKEWMGTREGEKYAHRYFTRTIGRLAADLITTGKVRDFVEVTKSIYSRERKDWIYDTYILIRYTTGKAKHNLIG